MNINPFEVGLGSVDALKLGRDMMDPKLLLSFYVGDGNDPDEVIVAHGEPLAPVSLGERLRARSVPRCGRVGAGAGGPARGRDGRQRRGRGAALRLVQCALCQCASCSALAVSLRGA